MRKLLAAGIVAAGSLGVSLQAGAVATIYEIDGSFSKVENRCSQIDFSFGGADCSYGRNRPGAAPGWHGPLFGGGHYAPDGVKDQVNYIPTSGSFNATTSTFTPAVPDGKLAAPVTGTFTIDDNGTPGNPTDDQISASFSIGAMARSLATGQSSRVVQRWTTMNHTMSATAVNALATVANGSGGVDYVIGSRGFPALICNATNSADCFPSENASATFDDYIGDEPVSMWTPRPVGQIGIERVGLLGDPSFMAVQPPPNPPTGNRGAATTASFTGYSCSNNVSTDCANNVLVWGGGEPLGFDNMVMKISTDGTGAISAATIIWTEEYFIGVGGPPPGYDNSFQSGTITFTGIEQSQAPTARDFAATVIEDTATNSLNAIGNVVNMTPPITISIVTQPAAGTATVNGGTINYDASGVGPSTQTIVYRATNGVDTDDGTITVTVAADIAPVAPDGGMPPISTQGAAPGSGTVGSVNVALLTGYVAGNTPATVALSLPNPVNGVASLVGGTTIRYTPSATFFAGTDTFGYTLTDSNGDTDTGVITVTVTDVTPALANGTITTEQDRTSSQLTLGTTPGNGSIAQHTLRVKTQASNGTCTAVSSTKMTYTPTGGYFGSDSCEMELVDGDGDPSPGATISITVTEADNQLKLPGGGSALDLWSLSLLGALPLLRRRRRA